MKREIFCFLFVVSGLFACDRPVPKLEDSPTYSHRQKVQYLFQRIGEARLQTQDSLTKQRMISFTVFRDGRLSIGHLGDHRVKIYSQDGTFIESISRKGTGPGQTAMLGSHSIDDHGRVWILDVALNQLTVYGTNGSVHDTWRPYDNCKKCMIDRWTMRTTKDRIYLSTLRVVDTAIVSNVASLVTAYDLDYQPIAYYGRFDENVKEISQWRCTHTIDSTGALYLLHNNTNTVQKYSPDGTLIKRFNYPVKEYTTNPDAQPDVKDYTWRHNAYKRDLDQWLWSATFTGRIEITRTYLIISFANMDSIYVRNPEKSLGFPPLAYRNEFLQIFDLDGNCLVDYLKSPGEFLSIDSSGILYFREDDDPNNMLISKYTFSVRSE